MSSPSSTVYLAINNCMKCPKHDTERVYTRDSSENVFKVLCKDLPGAEPIRKYYEFNDGAVQPPDQCPLRKT